MRLAIGYWLLGFVFMSAAHPTAAQELGDARAGFAHAGQVCSQCHAIRKGDRASPNERAPAFELVANTRGMTEMALRVWFQTPHPTMPNLMLSAEQKDNLIAYILTLKERP